MTITRIETGPRMSQAVIHNDTIYLSGVVGAPGEPIEAQTRVVLTEIERLLEVAGSSKLHILSATIWLADMADFAAMNAIWDEWVAEGGAPARATGGCALATPAYRIEMIVVAAKP